MKYKGIQPAAIQRQKGNVVTEKKLKIPKTRKQVRLWVHPVGQVIGSLFVREQSLNHEGEEAPHEVLNQDRAFVVVYLDSPSGLRFYHRNSIIRIEYENEQNDGEADIQVISCELTLMDGSVISGEIRERLPADHSRLYDYLNQETTRFIKLHVENDQICLINKSYINYVTTAAQ